MIKKSIFENDLIIGMQIKLAAAEKEQGINKLAKAVDYIHAAAEILEESRMTTKADRLLQILQKIAEDQQDAKKTVDRHTKGLTSEKMVSNLKHHGTVFNLAKDHKTQDLLNAEIGSEGLEVMDEPSDIDFEDEID